nr:hypothetical protein [Candidatus Sigynarchaeota archaeon]
MTYDLSPEVLACGTETWSVLKDRLDALCKDLTGSVVASSEALARVDPAYIDKFLDIATLPSIVVEGHHNLILRIIISAGEIFGTGPGTFSEDEWISGWIRSNLDLGPGITLDMAGYADFLRRFVPRVVTLSWPDCVLAKLAIYLFRISPLQSGGFQYFEARLLNPRNEVFSIFGRFNSYPKVVQVFLPERVAGWTWDQFVTNINLLSKVSREWYVAFSDRMLLRMKTCLYRDHWDEDPLEQIQRRIERGESLANNREILNIPEFTDEFLQSQYKHWNSEDALHDTNEYEFNRLAAEMLGINSPWCLDHLDLTFDHRDEQV